MLYCVVPAFLCLKLLYGKLQSRHVLHSRYMHCLLCTGSQYTRLFAEFHVLYNEFNCMIHNRFSAKHVQTQHVHFIAWQVLAGRCANECGVRWQGPNGSRTYVSFWSISQKLTTFFSLFSCFFSISLSYYALRSGIFVAFKGSKFFSESLHFRAECFNFLPYARSVGRDPFRQNIPCVFAKF